MDDHINTDGLYSPRQVSKLESCCLATVYQRLARGEYTALKDGRKTLIEGSQILARRRAKLKPAHFKAPPPPPPSRFHTIRSA
jgi:hypothetical protein